MLDVSVRLGVLNLLRGLCDDDHLAILYITHDIASARYIADEVIVMYAGQVVEHSRGTALVDEPTHPYTQLLIASVPDPADPTSVGAADGRAGADGHRGEGLSVQPALSPRDGPLSRRRPPQFIVGEDHTSRCWLYADKPQFEVEVALPQRRGEGETTKT